MYNITNLDIHSTPIVIPNMTSNIAKKTGKVKIDDRIVLNVGGWRFETRLSTLECFPYTRLGELSYAQHMDTSWDPARGEYFFDRNGAAFCCILQMYRTGEFHPDLNLCGNLLKMELDFWGVSEVDIESCCWGNYSKSKDHKNALSALDDNFTTLYYKETSENLGKWQMFKRGAWQFLEEPSSSRAAKCFAVISMFFVLLSIASFCLETHDLFRVMKPGFVINKTTVLNSQDGRDGAECCCIRRYDPNYTSHSDPHPAMAYIDLLCIVYFTLEYCIRLFFAPKKMQFLRQPLNSIDFICLIPYYVQVSMKIAGSYDDSNASTLVRALLSLRMIRVLRIFKIMKHYTAFKILIYTIKVSLKELLLIVVFLFTGVLIFASIIYYVENPPFTSIPMGFWWALVTMTTVGYGDRVPQSEGGYVVGSVCVLCGVLTIAFTVPIVVNNFTLYYSHAQSRIRLPPEKLSEIKKRMLKKSQRTKIAVIGKTGNAEKGRRDKPYDFNTIKVSPYIRKAETHRSNVTDIDEPRNVNSETVIISEQKSQVTHTSWTRHKHMANTKTFTARQGGSGKP